MSADAGAARAPLTVGAVAALLGGQVRAVLGPAGREVTHPAPLATAGSGALTFCTAHGPRAAELLRASRAAAVLCGPGADLEPGGGEAGPALLIVDEPRLSFIRVVEALFSPPPPRGIHPTAAVHPEAEVAEDAYVGPYAIVGRCTVGPGTVIHGHVHLYDGTRIGRNVTIHAGAVVGADGFGYHRNEAGEFEKFPHLGGVVIEDGVEIGANTCVDRGTLGDTLIREGAKVDNLVHIAHNVVVGRHAAVIAHAMVGGSTRIGDYAWVAPCACLRDGLEIGARSTVGLGALVVKPVAEGATVMGAPAREAAEYRAQLAALGRLGAAGDAA